MMPIVDLHCDLLSYLAGREDREATNEEVRCSLPQLKEGNVFLQVLAIFTETGRNSVALAEKQFTIFRTLPNLYPDDFHHLKKLEMPESKEEVHILAAIENASGLCQENEKLENAFSRFDLYRETTMKIVLAGAIIPKSV